MIELKPCPFCGKEVEIKEEGDWVEVVCEDCGIVTLCATWKGLEVE